MYETSVSLRGRTATIHTKREHAIPIDTHEPVYALGGLGFWLLMEPTHFRVTGCQAHVMDDVIVSASARLLSRIYGQQAVMAVRALMISIDDGEPLPASPDAVEVFHLTAKFQQRGAA